MAMVSSSHFAQEPSSNFTLLAFKARNHSLEVSVDGSAIMWVKQLIVVKYGSNNGKIW
jgi:hypothetical protein